jgi:hypothetical protein
LVKDASGNVGIGTTSPAAKLDVNVSSGNNIQLTKSTGASLVFSDGALRASIAGINGSDGITIATGAASTERMRIDSSGNLLFNSGYGSVATAYGCRAWVNFNGTGTVTINGSGNVSSITDGGTGTYTANFTTAIVDANYSSLMTIGTNSNRGVASDSASTSSIGLRSYITSTGALEDQPRVCVSIFR